MKKLTLLFISLLMAFAAVAQQNPNRVIVWGSTGTEGYLAERVDSITFRQVEGVVAADVVFDSYKAGEGEDSDTLKLSITPTEACFYYVLDIVPTVIANGYGDEGLVALMERGEYEAQYDGFEMAQLTGVKLEAATDYDIVTLGYDNLGIACSVRRATFSTPGVSVIGNPYVEMTVTDVQQYEFTVHFEPNADVSAYYVLAMEEGQFDMQYNMFAPMFGFKNPGEMVKMWGAVPAEDTGDWTWTSMSPNTNYEVFVQALDAEGNYAELQKTVVTTLGLGGEGEAKVDVSVTGYYMDTWWDEEGNEVILPTLDILYAPNDQASCYRFHVAYAADYDKDPQLYIDEVCQEPPMPNMANWFYYEPIEGNYQVNTNTEIVIIAAGKNINDEWGEPTIYRYTTPETVEGGDTPAPLDGSNTGKVRQKPIPVTISSTPMFPNVTVKATKKAIVIK